MEERADLIARLGRFAAADRSNARHLGAGPIQAALLARAGALEEAIAALGAQPAAAEPPPAAEVVGTGEVPDDRHMDDELGQDDAAASRAAPTRA